MDLKKAFNPEIVIKVEDLKKNKPTPDILNAIEQGIHDNFRFADSTFKILRDEQNNTLYLRRE